MALPTGNCSATLRLGALLLSSPMPLVTCPAQAQEAAQGDPAQGTGPLPPNVAPNPTPICTDQPKKATTTCTVPVGDFELETDLINWMSQTVDDVRTDTVLYTNLTPKYGVVKHTDVEINFAPAE